MERLLALKAGAGSGKTYRLALRYISLLLRGRDPNSILAITFTNKATKEMRERILKFLQFSDLPPEEQEGVLEGLTLESGLPKEVIRRKLEEGKLWEKVLQQELRITTIDSLLHQILRKFGVYIGVDPSFESWNGEDSQLERFFLEEVKGEERQVLLEYFKEEKRKKEILKELELLYSNWFYLEELVKAHWEGEEIGKLKKRYWVLKREVEQLEEEWDRLVEGRKRKPALKTFLSKLHEEDSKELEKYIKKQKISPEMERVGKRYLKLRWQFDLVKEKMEFFRLSQLINHYRQLQLTRQRERNLYSFTNVTLLVHSLLREGGKVDPHFLYFRLDSRFTDILIDEFQDTSLLQWEILEPIVEEIVAGIGSRDLLRSFFYVGDPNQGIYQWRGGEIRLFDGVCQRFQMTQQELGINYRSGREIVKFIEEQFKVSQTPRSGAPVGYIKVKQIDLKPSELKFLESVVEEVTQLIEKGVNPSQIGILGRKWEELRLLQQLLEERGIPVNSSDKGDLKDAPLSRGIWSLLRYLEGVKLGELKREKKPLWLEEFRVVGAPELELEELKERVEGLLQYHRPSQLIQKIIEEFGLESEETLSFWEFSLQFRSLSELLNRLEEGKVEWIGGEEEGVNLMTIHKSKGLEFDYLFLIDFLEERGIRKKFLIGYLDEGCHCNSGKRCRLRPKQVRYKLKISEYGNKPPTPLIWNKEYQQVLAEEKKRIVREEWNLLYVGMTRARLGLFIFCSSPKKGVILKHLNLHPGERGVLEIVGGKLEGRGGEVLELNWEEYPKWGRQQLEEEGPREETQQPELALYGRALHYGLEIREITGPLNRFGVLLEGKWERLEGDWRWTVRELERFIKELGECWIGREVPFLRNRWQFQADLILETPEKVVVIDYKSAFFSREERLEEYFQQVRNYLEGFEEITGKPAEGWLLLISQRRWIRVQ
ncbi:MAG: UvrD-helicase domain-containing protein [Campylobacterales bacterium]